MDYKGERGGGGPGHSWALKWHEGRSINSYNLTQELKPQVYSVNLSGAEGVQFNLTQKLKVYSFNLTQELKLYSGNLTGANGAQC